MTGKRRGHYDARMTLRVALGWIVAAALVAALAFAVIRTEASYQTILVPWRVLTGPR